MSAHAAPAPSFAWEDAWAVPVPDALRGAGWAHHGLAVTADRRLVGAQSGGAEVCVFDPDGGLLDSWPTGLVEAHGMALAGPPGGERLWIADPGFAMRPDGGGAYEQHTPAPHGRVRCFDLTGRCLGGLPLPALPAYASARYAPTAVAVDDGPEGDGSIWVADGYGQSLVHRFSADGRLELTLTGEEGAGRFACPHAVLVDRRTDRPRLYVTDRGNARLQLYDLDGRFLAAVTDGLRSPSALVTFGRELIVAELHARLAVLDAADRLVGYVGQDEEAPERAGWPNAIDADGRVVRPPLEAGRFNSPHGLAVDAHGDLYVAEWLIGGRITRLRRRAPGRHPACAGRAASHGVPASQPPST